jgi:5'-3' exoribonuclease 1
MRTNVESAKVKLGQRCFVGYPFLQEAKIVKVSDELFDYTLAEDGSKQVIPRNHQPREIEDWTKKASRIENFYSKRLGILIGSVESLVSVQMLKGLIKTDEGATIKEYGDIPGMETEYASQIIVDEVVNEDERFIEKAALPVEEEFPLKSIGFFLGDYNYGQPLEVGGYTNGKLVIWLSVLEKREPDFARKIIHDAQKGMHYLPSYMVAKQLDLHPLALSKITSSYFIRTVGDLRVNLGLNLKFEARKQKVLGYSRKSQTGWEFSAAAIHLIVEYMTRFPDFFAGVKRNPSGAELTEKDLWTDPAVGSTRVKEIGAWLKTLKTSSMERVPLDAEQLDSDVVMRLATEADNLQLAAIGSNSKKMNGVPRNAVMRPEDAEHRLGNQHFSLGDRVVYVASTGKVPIAFRGTVIGISRTPTAKLLDVVFDVTFMSGTTLGDRCPPFRGQTVPATVLLNLSNHQVVAGSKAQVARQPISPSVTTLTAHGGYHMNGKRFQDASAPAPLQGSWRGAINGGNRGGRGGGQRGANYGNLPHRPHHQQSDGPYNSANGQGQGGRGRGGGQFRGRGGGGGGGAPFRGGRGGYPDGGDGIAHPASAPPMYGAVPPPASLDAPRGGRGRGRGGRGRGDGQGFRGRGGGRGGAQGQQQQQQPQQAAPPS